MMSEYLLNMSGVFFWVDYVILFKIYRGRYGFCLRVGILWFSI